MFLISPAYADAGAAPGGLGWAGFALQMGVIGLFFYLIILRPQQKKAKDHQLMIDALAKGDEVVTSGGLMGKVTKVGEKSFSIAIADKVEIQVTRSSIAQKLEKGTL